MKKKHRFFELTGALLAAALIISGCQDVLNKPEDSETSAQNPPGKVLITIASGGARTLAPTAAELGITQYELTFSSPSATHSDVTITSGTSEIVTLALENWTINVQARAGSTLKAEGSWSGAINEDGRTIDIPLRPAETGQGTFLYNITFLDLGINGTKSLTLYSVSESGGETVVSGTPVTDFSSGRADQIAVPAGAFYRLQVTLTNSDSVPKSVSKTEAVHIYTGLPTSALWQFEAEDFTERVKTGIRVSSPPDVTVYAKNQSCPPNYWDGLAVAETWSDGTEPPLASSAYTVSPALLDTSVPGPKYLTISSGPYTTTFDDIMVTTTDKILTGITVNPFPTQREYELGQNLNFSGMVITGTYSDGTTGPITTYTYSGYDKMRRGIQTITVKVNQFPPATFDVEVKVPASAVMTVNQNVSGGALHIFYRMEVIKGRPLPDAGLPENLKVTVTTGGSSMVLTKADGDFTSSDLSGYNQNQTGFQTLTLTLDNKTVSFPIYVMDVDPNLWFDYGYWRHPGNPQGGATLTAPQTPQYTVPVNTELVISPVVFSMNTDTPSYTWSVISSAGTYASSQSGQNNKFFHITPSVTGTYEVEVNVTAGSFTGMARATIVCTAARPSTPPAPVSNAEFSGRYPAPSGDTTHYNPPYIKNFAPGQFTTSGSGYGWSLGTWGGYMVWKLRKGGAEDIQITGNSFGGWSEPGIVWVSVDDNQDGLPNDTWYELKGSDDSDSRYQNLITRSYGIRHIRTSQLNFWVDSKGRTGEMILSWWPSSWGMAVTDNAWVEFAGTYLRDQGDMYDSGGLNLSAVAMGWGYVDSQNAGVAAAGRAVDRYRISDAIRADGSSANLPYIDFVRVQNGVFFYGGVGGYFHGSRVG
jgi:hypothetical protein